MIETLEMSPQLKEIITTLVRETPELIPDIVKLWASESHLIWKLAMEQNRYTEASIWSSRSFRLSKCVRTLHG